MTFVDEPATISRADSAPKLSRLLNQTRRFSQACILIVDDDPTAVALLERWLGISGYQNLHSTTDPDLAMSMVREHRPDVVLLDIIMPRRSGLDLLTQIRDDDEHQHTPVIILTASTDSEAKYNALEYGATDFLAKPVDSSELTLRVRNTLAAKAYQDRLTFEDELTGLPNRRQFFRRLEALLGNPARSGACAVLHIDVDNFKTINDSLGLDAGDVLLQSVAARLTDRIHSAESAAKYGLGAERPSVFRLGGDEFTVLLPQIKNHEDVASIARQLQHAMDAPIAAAEQELYTSLSIGIATADHRDIAAADLLEQAEAAMYQAKESGRGHYRFYSTDFNSHALERLSLSNDLRVAVERNELELLYQPKTDSQSGSFNSAEALIRWNHPSLGLLSPDTFIYLAEESDLIIGIGAWVMREACEHAIRMQAAGWDGFSISVNVASKQFRHPGFMKSLKTILATTGLQPRNLTLELTERTIMDDARENITMLGYLNAMGVRLSIDDFGTEYSSLAYLRRFPIHELKIDRSFIIDLEDEQNGEAIVAAIINLAHALGISVVAEGVESDAQARFLRVHGCEELQGHLFSPAIQAVQLLEFARKLRGT